MNFVAETVSILVDDPASFDFIVSGWKPEVVGELIEGKAPIIKWTARTTKVYKPEPIKDYIGLKRAYLSFVKDEFAKLLKDKKNERN